MRRLVIAAAAWGIGVACTRANPSFGDAADTTDGGTVDATTASVPTGTTEALTLDPDGTTVGEDATSDPSGSEVGSETGSRPDLGGDVGMCDDAPSAVRVLEVTEDGVDLDCPPLRHTTGAVLQSVANELRVRDCGHCDVCPGDAPEVRFKAMGIAMPVIAVGRCVEVVVAHAPGCALRSIAVSDTLDELPLLISATDTFSLPPTLPYPAGLDVPQVEMFCTRDGCEDAGDYTLGFGTASYGRGTAEVEVPLFDGAFDFDLKVQNAGVDGSCEIDVAWDAQGIVL